MKSKMPVSLDVTHIMLAVLFIGVLIASSFWILRPFLIPLIWAALIVVATWPALVKLQSLLGGRRGLTVALMTVTILLVVLIPLTLAVLAIVNNAEDITLKVRSLATFSLSSPPDWVDDIPLAGEKLATSWREFSARSPEERSSIVAPYAGKLLQWFIAQAGSIGITLLQLVLTAVISAIMYANGETIRSAVMSFARRLAGARGEEAAVLAGKAIRGVALGVVLTAILQASLGGIGLAVTGVPAAALLTALMFMLCLAQIGPSLVLIPAVVWLYLHHGPLRGTILLIFSVVAATMDNVIRPVLIRKGADLPILMIFAGVIGGLIAFGITGLFIGPVVLAVAYTLLKAWVAGNIEEKAAAASNAE